MFPIYLYHVCFTDKYNNQHAYYIFIIIEFNQELDITKIAVTVESQWHHVKRHCQRGVGYLRTDTDAMALILSDFIWKKTNSLTGSTSDCRQFFALSFPRLMCNFFASV